MNGLVGRLVLDHRLGRSAFTGSGDEAHEAPPLGSGKRPRLFDQDCVADVGLVGFVVRLELRCQADDPLVQGMPRLALDGDDDRLVHLVADDAADHGLPLALHCCSCHRVISYAVRERTSRRSRCTVRIRAIVCLV